MSQALQKQEKPTTVRQMLVAYKDQIQAALPKHMDANRMARIVTTELRKTPQLQQCNPITLFGAVIQAAQLGLEPGNALGHCYLIPYKQDVNLIVGYRGMIDLARRSGQIISLSARAVYEADDFQYEFGLDEDLRHVPSTEAERGELTYVYAVAKLQGGGVQFDVMSRIEVEAIRQKSPAGKSGPWVTHFEEMAKKTVIRRLFKYLPVSIEIQKAVALDEMADAGIDQQNDALILDGDWSAEPETSEPQSKTEAVTEKLKAKAGKEEPTTKPGAPFNYAEIMDMVNNAENEEQVNEALDLAKDCLVEDQQQEISDAATAKKKALYKAASGK